MGSGARRLALSLACVGACIAMPAAVAQRRRPPARRQAPALPRVPEPRAAELDRQAPRAEWPRVVGWPRELASPPIEAVGDSGVTVVRRRFPDGTAELRALGTGDFAPTWRSWLEAVRVRGGTVEDERTGIGWASASVCATDCAHGTRYFASLTLDSWLRFTLRAAARTPPSPPGACTAVPADEWHICFEGAQGTQCSFAYGTRWDIDVDRDGHPDALVAQPAARAPERTCPNEVEWDVYVSRASCGHHVGRLRGEPDRWHRATTELAHGFVVVTTNIDPDGPWDEPITVRNAFDGARYREVALTRHEARCSYHPADCETSSRLVCAVRGHPSIVSPWDWREASALVNRLAEQAQAQCGANVTSPVRCSIDFEFRNDGTGRMVRFGGCGRAATCVDRIFRGARLAPHAGELGRIGISFQIPRP